MTSETYADFGIRTINGAYWLLVFMAVLAINTVVVYAVRTHEVYRAALAGFWVLAITIGTVRALRRLATLEKSEATKFAFERVMLEPILGLVPLILLWLP
jgi:cytochrome c biogenesis protein ResB